MDGCRAGFEYHRPPRHLVTDSDEMSLREVEYEAVDQPEELLVTSPSTSSQLSQMSTLTEGVPSEDSPSAHRTRLPFPMFSRDDFSIWHILRQCIGKVAYWFCRARVSTKEILTRRKGLSRICMIHIISQLA